MIVGHFDAFGRPYVKGRVIIPRLDVSENVSFLVDTGADSTCLHPRDALGAGVPFGRLRNRELSRGIGGSSPYFHEPATLVFPDGRAARLYGVGLLIAEPDEANGNLPSLLGRNVINHWYMAYDPANGRLECTARYADRTIGQV